VPDSLSFDRAADYYDTTRALSPKQTQQTVDVLAREILNKRPTLEVGIGTGRIGIPFFKANELFGIDLSMAMLRKLRAKSTAVPVAQGDATRLPFRDHSFGGAYAMWVLHLIAPWQVALTEMLRVVRSGGVILVTIGGIRAFGEGPWSEIIGDFRAVTGVERNLGANDVFEIDEFMATKGIQGREAAVIHNTLELPPAEVIRRLRDNVFSFTWRLDNDVRLDATGEVEERARRRYGDLEHPHAHKIRTRWHAYDVP
jgi:SAM-dependent methyltransferase